MHGTEKTELCVSRLSCLAEMPGVAALDSSFGLGRLLSQSSQLSPKSSDAWGERSFALAFESAAQ